MSAPLTKYELEEIRTRDQIKQHAFYSVPPSQTDRRKLLAEVDRLRDAIIKHRAQHADDRCWLEDDRLYEVLGDGIKCDRRVGDKTVMLENCRRFLDQRCEFGGPWKSYADLETEVKTLKTEVKTLKTEVKSLKRRLESRH